MNYLLICKNITNSAENEYKGLVQPRTYGRWAEISPMILCLEGIHQFCVKAAKAVFSSPLKNIRHVPVQLRDLIIEKNFSYNNFKITGYVTWSSEYCEVCFSVNEQHLILSGVVVISLLREIARETAL